MLLPKDDINQKETLQFIKTASFKEDWKELKALYKQLETNVVPELMVALIDRFDKAGKLELEGAYPSWKTLGYMKRRAARFLRKLASENEQGYIQICKDLMLLQRDKMNLEYQWVMKQILLGASKRFEQKQNGRGKIIQLEGVLNIARSEELFAEVWDKYPAVLELILAEKGLAIEVYEFCVKVFLRNHRPLPLFDFQVLDQFFENKSPFLRHVAVKQGFQFFERYKLKRPKLAAWLFFFSNPKQQNILLNHLGEIELPEQKTNSVFDKISNLLTNTNNIQGTEEQAFVNHLVHIAFGQLCRTSQFSKRVERSLNFLIKIKSLIHHETILQNAGAIISTEQPKWIQLIFETIQALGRKYTEQWLTALEDINVTLKKSLFRRLLSNYGSRNIEELEQFIRASFLKHPHFYVVDFVWFVLADNEKLRKKVTNSFLWDLRWHNFNEPFLRNMIRSHFAASVLLEHYSWYTEYILFEHNKLVYIIQNGHPDFKQAAIRHLLKESKHKFFQNLPLIAKLEELRTDVLGQIEPKISYTLFNTNALFACLKSSQKWISENAWRILEKLILNEMDIRNIIFWIFYQIQEDQIADFISRLAKVKNPLFKNNFTLALKNVILYQPQLINRMASHIEAIMQLLDIETILEIVKAVDDQNWETIKPSICSFIEEDSAADFWLSILEKLPNEESETTLVNRFLEDSALYQPFLDIKTPNVLDCHHPAFEDLLSEWLRLNENIFEANSSNLFKASTHRTPKIRNWALERAVNLGMDVPFAMQLLESGLPDSVKIGKQFFESVKAGTTDELENLLALCDSPNPEVRAYGMTFFQSRKNNFDNALALECLSEHTDPIIHEFVAEKLKSMASKATFTENFDRSVLRTKNQSRKAKELIKNRLAKDLNVSSDTLLELARGHNRKDREWALEQLAKMVLTGEKISGFNLATI